VRKAVLPLGLYTTADNFLAVNLLKAHSAVGFRVECLQPQPREGVGRSGGGGRCCDNSARNHRAGQQSDSCDPQGGPPENARTPPSGYHDDEQAHQRQDGQVRAKKRGHANEDHIA
jgi:hypothetical protein